MLIRVFFDDNSEIVQFEYYSKYNKMNVKELEKEIRDRMYKIFGEKAKYMPIKKYERIDD